jgi:hypothetical protein
MDKHLDLCPSMAKSVFCVKLSRVASFSFIAIHPLAPVKHYDSDTLIRELKTEVIMSAMSRLMKSDIRCEQNLVPD